MAKDPAVLFYTGDFLVGTYGFTDSQVGQYIRLLCLQHQQGHLDKDTMIEVMRGQEDMKIICKFCVDDNGLYFNKRMDEEITRRVKYSQSRSKNRLNASSDKHMNNICKSHDEHMETGTETVNDTDSESKTTLDEERFTEFWSIYPKKVGKKAAYASWKRIKVTAELHDKILSTIRLQKTGAQWKKDNGQYIPNPATWLNQGRWDDEITADAGKGKNYKNPFYDLAKEYEERGE